MDENGEILLLHASKNNARPLVLPWFDDFAPEDFWRQQIDGNALHTQRSQCTMTIESSKIPINPQKLRFHIEKLVEM